MLLNQLDTVYNFFSVGRLSKFCWKLHSSDWERIWVPQIWFFLGGGCTV